MAKEKFVKIRKPFYSCSDGVRQLFDVSNDQGKEDKELNELVSELSLKLDEIELHLNSNYKWD